MLKSDQSLKNVGEDSRYGLQRYLRQISDKVISPEFPAKRGNRFATISHFVCSRKTWKYFAK